MKKKHKVIITILLIIGTSIGTYFTFTDKGSAVVIAYKSYKVTEKKMEITHKFAGEVIPNVIEKIPFDPLKGTYELAVKKGEQVKKGQLLFKYNDSSMKLSVNEVEIEKKFAEKKVELQKKQIEVLKQKLHRERQVGSSQEILKVIETETQQLQLQLEMQKIEVEKASEILQINKEKLKTLVVTSPVSGVIEDITNDVDERTGINGINIYTGGPLKVSGQLSEYELGQVKIGQGITVASKTTPGKTWIGKVTEISTTPLKSMDENKTLSNYQFIVTLDNHEELQTGFHVDITSNSGEVTGTVIPKRSILKKGDTNVVFIVKGSRVKEQAVTVEFERDNEVKVSGVKKGDQIIYNPQKTLKDGMEVFIK